MHKRKRAHFLHAILAGVVTWSSLIVLASILGAVASCYTGKASELPKWNGWQYLLFSAKEFAKFGAVLSGPVAVAAFGFAALRRSELPVPPSDLEDGG